MKIKSKLKNTILAGLTGLTLTACGGGGGAGTAVGTISNWVNNDLTELNSSYVTRWTDLISLANAKISEEGQAGAILSSPTGQDILKANEMISMLQEAETLWADTLNDLDNLPDAKKYEMLNDVDFQNAYKAMEYLKNTVKPLLQKVATGNKLNMDEYSKVKDTDEATKIQNNVDVNSYVATKKIKSTVPGREEQEIYNETEASGEMSIVPITDWTTVFEGGGKETRDVWQVTPQNSVVKKRICTWDEVTKITETGSQTFKENEICKTKTITTPTDELKVKVTQEQAGDNPIVDREEIIKVLGTAVTETQNERPDNTLDKSVSNPDEIQELSWSTATENILKVRYENTNDQNIKVKITDKYLKTTVTKPILVIKSVTQHWTDKILIDERTTTPWTKTQVVIFKDGSKATETISTGTDHTAWQTKQKSESNRSVKVEDDPINDYYPADVSEKFVEEVSRETINNAYTVNDVNLGTPTEGASSVKSDHETQEYYNTNGLKIINASSAYARGWTGKGSVLGVIDTYQDIHHEDLDGKYKWYYDYPKDEGYTITNNKNHGTHVAGTMVGKKNGSETHGVAYDAELVGANVDKRNNGGISFGMAQMALHDMAKLKQPVENGGKGINLIAINMSINSKSNFIEVRRDDNNEFIRDDNGQIKKFSTVTTLSDGTYNTWAITSRVQSDSGADNWKVATDNDIILVNSAGNDGWAHPTMPANFATEEKDDGTLILGGKMIIVGNWDPATKSNVGNLAGHVCLQVDVANNLCKDNYRTSDFYLMAPGNQIRNATTNGTTYGNMGGTSMAAPHVTGSLGILHQMWPHMKGENLVKLVLDTADKDLPGYHVNVHGQGLLDLDEATKPQGAMGIVTTGRVDHPTVDIGNTYLTSGSGWISGLSDLNIMVIDDYDRDYYVNLGSSFVVVDKRKFSDVHMLVNNNNTFLPQQQMYGSFTQGGQYNLAKNYSFGFYTGENGNGDFSLNLGKDFFVNDKLKFTTSLGHMSEQDTWLGNSSDGVLSVGDNNDTLSANIGVAYQLGNNVLSLDYSKGNTDVNTVDNSLIKSFSDIETESYRLAYEIHKDTHTTFGWSFSLPSHITSGTMDLEVAESVNIDGTINYTNINSDLTQRTKEKNIGFYYNKTGADELDASFNFTAEYRMDKSGVANNDGVEVAMNYVKKFAGSCKFLWMKNPRCFDKEGNMKSDLFNTKTDNATKHGLVYDLETDKFVPIEK